MKLYTFTTVKDEEDIIESFVRYHLNIVDGMVISDNCSNDSTLTILKKLKEEGLNIDVLEDKSQYFDQNKKRKALLDYTMKKYKPDFVFPIDADEFISSKNNVNPRKFIEKLDKNKLYLYKMINYIITPNDDKNELFIPKKMNYQRIENTKEGNTFKSFIPSKLYNKHFVMTMGCHSAFYDNGKELQEEKLDKIFLAHYPVRSKKQITNKVIIGRLNNSSLHSREEGLGFHQYEILDEIIKNGKISNKTLNNISMTYGVLNKENLNKKIFNPLIISFCKDLEIKYYNPKSTDLLSNTIKASETIINHMREENIKIKNDYATLKDKYDNEKSKYEELEKIYNQVINSKRYKIMDKICNIIKK